MNKLVLFQNTRDGGTAFATKFIGLKSNACFDDELSIGKCFFATVAFMLKHQCTIAQIYIRDFIHLPVDSDKCITVVTLVRLF